MRSEASYLTELRKNFYHPLRRVIPMDWKEEMIEEVAWLDGYARGFIESTIDTECSLGIAKTGIGEEKKYFIPYMSLAMIKGSPLEFVKYFKELWEELEVR